MSHPSAEIFTACCFHKSFATAHRWLASTSWEEGTSLGWKLSPLPSSLGGCLPNLLLSEALWEQGEGANGSSTQNGRVMGTQSLCWIILLTLLRAQLMYQNTLFAKLLKKHTLSICGSICSSDSLSFTIWLLIDMLECLSVIHDQRLHA